jgi:lysophospholipase L1-like esterase
MTGITPLPPRRLSVAAAMVLAVAALVQPAASQSRSPAGASAQADVCAVPPEFVNMPTPLRHTRAAFKAGKSIRIVALGTSSTAGTGAATRADAYPAKLQSELSRLLPGAKIIVINQGIGGQSTRQMVDRIEDDVVALEPTLVIWQTGTVDTVNNIDVEEFGHAISQGIDILKKEDVDVILMNMQYSRRMELLLNYDPYDDMMGAVAAQSDVAVFDRLGIMKYWAYSGRFDYDNVPRNERRQLAAKVHGCLGRLLAEIVHKAVR